MYVNLKGEIAKCSISNSEIANFLGIHENTFCNKINGKSRFTIEEAFAIKSKYFQKSEFPLEYLFANTETQKNEKAS